MTNFKNSAADLFGNGNNKSYARFPVWSGSVRGEVKFRPLGANRRDAKRAAVRLYHNARRFERRTRKPGMQDGAIGRNGLAVLHAMLFDFINYVTGRLDPSYEQLAHRANISIRSVARGLRKLRDAKVISWIKRVYEKKNPPGYAWEMSQDTNAYAIAPETQWKGFNAPGAPPPPEPGTTGAPDVVLDPVAAVAVDVAAGAELELERVARAVELQAAYDPLMASALRLKPAARP